MHQIVLPHALRKARTLGHLIVPAEGSQIAEFAISLPLLMVLIVGIFDFGSAFTVKLKVSNAALEGARIASTLPITDLSQAQPASLAAVVGSVDNALFRANINDCGLFPVTTWPTPVGLSWTFTASGNGCPGTLTLIIDRGFTYTAGLTPPFPANYNVEATKVTIKYPYKWQFNNVIKLITSSAGYPANSSITSTAVMQNLN